MTKYICLRVLSTLPVMGVVALFVFVLLRIAPGDPAAVIAGDYATAEDVARIREQLGLADPLAVQFLRWLGALVQGDLGTSIFSNKPVTELIAQRVEPTLLLALSTILFSVVVAVPLGTVAAYRAGSVIDYRRTSRSCLPAKVPVLADLSVIRAGFCFTGIPIHKAEAIPNKESAVPE